MEPMEITTGFPAFRVRSSSWRISSEAKALPPPLSTRRTIALIRLSFRALRICLLSELEPIWPTFDSPYTIFPWATMMPTLSSPCPGFVYDGVMVVR